MNAKLKENRGDGVENSCHPENLTQTVRTIAGMIDHCSRILLWEAELFGTVSRVPRHMNFNRDNSIARRPSLPSLRHLAFLKIRLVLSPNN